MKPEEIKATLEAERQALLDEDTSKKTDIELLVKAEKYAKGEIKSLQETLKKAGVVVTTEQAICIQTTILENKLEWLRSQKTPTAISEKMEGWN
ncbi:MAG: hypothetical protein DRP58_12225 [Spirochaetes bacterium]|nr:MAG: hypothetical protein DRP58_12225 [Spirochaetota bacterium]